MSADERLAQILGDIERHDNDYDTRYGLVFEALSVALGAGYAAGIRFDPEQPEWPVAYLELPTGQVSWHLPQHQRSWDEHDTPTKYERCKAFIASVHGTV